MKKNKLSEINEGNGLYRIKINQGQFEVKGQTLTEKLKFAIKDFLRFPDKRHPATTVKTQPTHLTGKKVSIK